MSNATLSCRALPAVQCSACGERNIEVQVSFPSLRIPAAVNPRFLKRMVTTVDQPTWYKICAAFSADNPRFTTFVPGMHIRPIILRTTGKLRDLLCSGIEIFFSRRVIEQLQSAGILIHPYPVQVYKRGVRVQDYYVLEPKVVSVTDSGWMRKCYSQCKCCKAWKRRIPFKEYLAHDKDRKFDKSRWPGREGVVYTPDRPFVLYSETFVKACESNLAGLVFEQAGKWV